MDKGAKSYNEQLMALGKTFAEEMSGIWQRYSRMETNYREAMTPQQVGQGVKKFWQEDSPAYFRDMVQLQTDYYLKALKMGMDYNQKFFETIFTTQPVSPQTQVCSKNTTSPDGKNSNGKTHSPVAAATDILFNGKLGETLQQPFVVANNEASTIKVSFEMSEFVCQDGSTIEDVAVNFKPTSFSLASDEDKVIKCSITPDARFQTNQQYIAIARVVGFPNMMVRLILELTKKE